MGATTKYGFPWPANAALVKDGASAIRSLAEAVETALLPPLLVTDGDGTVNWTDKVAEVPWDVSDNPDRKRGSWASPGANEKLVIPGTPGYYLVSSTIRFGGKSEPDVYEVSIRTRQTTDAVGTGVSWASQRIELPADSTDSSVVSVATVVRCADTDPRTGIAVRLSYAGTNAPPAIGQGINKLRIHWLSPL